MSKSVYKQELEKHDLPCYVQNIVRILDILNFTVIILQVVLQVWVSAIALLAVCKIFNIVLLFTCFNF